MKLLLDHMLSGAIAEQFRLRAHDVVAVAEREDLRLFADTGPFERAQHQGRADVQP